MNRDLEKSLKSRLRNIAYEKKVDPSLLWQSLVLERFLARLAQSQHAPHFVLKGGFLLANYLPIDRHTQDIDFLVQGISNDLNLLGEVIEQIARIDLSDGFEFSDVSVKELTHFHMKYPGARASMQVQFGKARFRLTIDLGFGDMVLPRKKVFSLIKGEKGTLFEGQVEISCYPMEFILAEKIEAVAKRGSGNSRMKDFHDIHTILKSGQVDRTRSLEITRSVFEHRQTAMKFPMIYDQAQIEKLQSFWESYLQSVTDKAVIPKEIGSVIDMINLWCNGEDYCPPRSLPGKERK